MTDLHVLAPRIDKLILTGMVGKATLDSSSSQPSKMCRRDKIAAKKAIVRQTRGRDEASQLENANRGSRKRKRSRRSLSERKNAILASRNIKRRKRSSPLPEPVSERHIAMQQTSTQEVPADLDSVSLTVRGMRRRKIAKPEDQYAKVQQCSSQMKEPVKNAKDTSAEVNEDKIAEPTLPNSCNKKKRVGRGSKVKQSIAGPTCIVQD